MRRLCSYYDRTVYALHVASFLLVGKEYAVQIISSRNKSRLYATHKIFFWAMSIDLATQICFYWVEKITFATRIRFFPIERYRSATQIVIFHSGRSWFASGFYLCGTRGLEILAGMIYAEALGLKNRPKTGIPDGRGLEYLIRIACDGTRGMVALVEMGFSESWGRWKLKVFWYRYFYMIRGGRVDMFARYFSKKLWGRMRYAPTLTDEKGAISLFAVGRGRGALARIGFFYLLRRWKLKVFWYRYFYTIRDGRVDMSARYFSRKLWGHMRYAPTLTDEKGAVSLFVVGRGRANVAGMGFFYLLGR